MGEIADAEQAGSPHSYWRRSLPQVGKPKLAALGALIFVCALLAAGPGYCESIPERIVLSRAFAVAMALSKNPDLRIEVLNSSMEELDLARSRGIYDTQFNAAADGGQTTDSGDSTYRSSNSYGSVGLSRYLSTGGNVAVSLQTSSFTADSDGTAATDWQSSVGITVSQPLLKNLGKEVTELSITLAASSLQDAVEQFRSVATDTVYDVITTYNHLFALRKVLEARVTALDVAQKLLEAIRTRKQGPLQRMEIANAEFAITQRRKDLVEAERNVSDEEASLRYLIGMETKNHIFPNDPPSRDEPPGTQEQAVKAALEFRTDLKQLQLALKTSQLQERVARNQSLPDLFVFASGALTGAGSRFGDSFQQAGEKPGTYWSAGVGFDVPLGNTAAENDYRKSKVRTEQLQNQIQALSWKIRDDVESDLRALISARLQIQTADRSAQFAEQRLEEYRKNNLAGTASVQDVINAENDLTSAHNAQMDALEAFANGVTKLWRDTGELLDRQDVHIDAAHPGKLLGSTGEPGW